MNPVSVPSLQQIEQMIMQLKLPTTLISANHTQPLNQQIPTPSQTDPDQRSNKNSLTEDQKQPPMENQYSSIVYDNFEDSYCFQEEAQPIQLRVLLPILPKDKAQSHIIKVASDQELPKATAERKNIPKTKIEQNKSNILIHKFNQHIYSLSHHNCKSSQITNNFLQNPSKKQKQYTVKTKYLKQNMRKDVNGHEKIQHSPKKKQLMCAGVQLHKFSDARQLLRGVHLKK